MFASCIPVLFVFPDSLLGGRDGSVSVGVPAGVPAGCGGVPAARG